MEAVLHAWLMTALAWFSLPENGLSTVFVVTFVSATLVPVGSEPVVFGLIKVQPDLFWPALGVATLGNTLGGALTWWMGRGAHHAAERLLRKPVDARALRWLQALGPKACLLSWVPVIGDPLCGLAGWLRLPFWPCLGWMALGKFARYFTATWLLLQVF